MHHTESGSNDCFRQFLASNIEIDDGVDELIAACKTIAVQKGTFLLRQGEICNFTFFVEKGLLRYYSIDDKGKEHLLQFAPETWFVTDRESVYFKNPSHYFIQAWEDSSVVLLDENFVMQLSKTNPAFLNFNNRLLHNHIRHLQNRINRLLSATAEQRYLHFIEIYPDLMLRVPQWMIASYLGITPESLSRVRKELAERHRQR